MEPAKKNKTLRTTKRTADIVKNSKIQNSTHICMRQKENPILTIAINTNFMQIIGTLNTSLKRLVNT